MEEKATMRLMVRLNLSSDDVRNCIETMFLRKGILNLAYIQGLSFEKSEEPDKYRTSKTLKSIQNSKW